ncbi:autotransporter outer membrane beta-barrel domain-containing protein [Pseudomonas extremorientalis]|uniref:Autotransporter outer membrane beta-barrel domain-containing protein n=1 Tax=Pseudomonas extremorientalis TaxID=169669 RepID=A0A1H0JMY7_9PSED|nr:autotransporter outer membrane beta-barrel domain-containing protein [Pseudomonas extremorientalis]KAB0519400.1 autotransporter outer membrane beta-barrel domain-containing protein [Pseudomonas extremorientalis]OIN12986.1 autotransporter outer membrane beta-barrel domain-containing protein [Pseudomonas extremorientalis]SDO45157.1 outer membrane autotransporter barrel domain-containing protein [Pseudomonas extremorientalis]
MRVRTLSWLYPIVIAIWPLASYGACTINNTVGDDISTCDSDSAPGFTDTGGNNTLNVSGTGQVNGNVTFGGGVDKVEISGGQVGAISQGAGIDSYAQSGGTVASVAQGDGRDTFRMSGGTITGAFEDGDDAKMTGGTIGRVDMKLDNNIFDMSGGRIIGNLVTGLGNDTILISGTAFVGGNISVSGGDDHVTVSGGEVNGQILLSFGNDDFIWTGGNLHSFVLMGAGDDTALLQNLTSAQLAAAQLVDGGLGNDKLTLDNTKAGDPGLLPNWETIQLDNGSELTLSGTTLKLGDSGSGTGTLGLDGTSTLLVGTGVIEAFTAGQLVSVSNSGLIDMTTGSSSPNDTLTLKGNYTGNGGRLALQSVLGGDGSPSDRLVIDQGVIGGSTAISVTNLGGAGAATLQDGIQVVQALNGASGSANAITLAAPVSAGAFDYRLFKGGVTAGTAENYYLRSTVPVQPPGPEIIVPLPSPGERPLPPNPGTEPEPIYRKEVPIYAALFPAADQIVRAMLGTYHERMGDQSQQQSGNGLAGWGRVYGSSSRQGFAGTVSPTLDSTVKGFQAGSDVYTATDDSGRTHRVGLFVSHSTLKGSVKGFNGGWQDLDAGKTTLRADSLGVYWTLIGANQAYLDLVLTGSRFNGNNESDRGVKMKTRGHNITASAEVGWPVQVTQDWKVEPQAQLIVGKTKLDSQNDGISDVKYDADTSVTSRLGVRLRGDYNVRGMPWQPYARANVWHASAGDNSVIYNRTTRIDTEQKSTTLEVSLGATVQVAPDVSLYGEVGYNRNLDSNTYNGREGTVGVRVAF